jgi:hypothetical protein
MVQLPIAAHHESVISWLDKHQGAVTVLLTAVLIGVTIYYAVQNARMVGEMRRAREIAVLPKLAVDLNFLGPLNAAVVVRSVGPGPALDIDVRLIYEPTDPNADPSERPWRRNLLASGEQLEFFSTGGANATNIDSLSATHKAIALKGSMRDATGTEHIVDERFDDLAEWRQVLEAASLRMPSEPDQRLARALGKELNSQAKTVAAALDRIGAQLSAFQSVDEDQTRKARSWLVARMRRHRPAPPS